MHQGTAPARHSAPARTSSLRATGTATAATEGSPFSEKWMNFRISEQPLIPPPPRPFFGKYNTFFSEKGLPLAVATAMVLLILNPILLPALAPYEKLREQCVS